MSATAGRRMNHFVLLYQDEQARAIRRLAASGMRLTTIAAATQLRNEMIRKVVGGQLALNEQSA